MHFGAAMIIHIAGINAPMRCEVHLKKRSHPVLLVLVSSQILKFQTCRECVSELIKKVCHEDIGQIYRLVGALFRTPGLHGPKESRLEFLCPLLFNVHADISEKQLSSLE